MEPAQNSRKGFVRWWLVAQTAILAAIIGIGIFQAQRIKLGLLTSYGHDLLLPAWLYSVYRHPNPSRWRLFSTSRFQAETAAALIFAGALLTEIAQKYGYLPGTYDFFDLVAFAVSILFCYAVDRKTRNLRGALESAKKLGLDSP